MDEPIAVPGSDAAPVETPATPVAEATSPVSADGAAPTTPEPIQDEFSLLENAFQAEPEAPADPNAALPQEPAVPEQFTQLLSMSPYVKQPEHVQAAIQAASEVWQVADGQIPARTLLEGMKNARPEQYQAVVNDLVAYLEQETGQKFGAASGEPLTPEQQRIAALEQRDQQRVQAAQQYQQQQTFQRADQVTQEKLGELTKGSFLEGDKDFVNDLFAALPGLKIDPKQMMQEVLSGKFDLLQKAKKGAEAKVVARVQAYNKKFIADARAKKQALPVSASGGGNQGGRSDEKFDLATREGRLAHAQANWQPA